MRVGLLRSLLSPAGHLSCQMERDSIILWGEGGADRALKRRRMGATHLTLDKLIVVVNWVEWVSSLSLASEGGSLFERVLDTWGSLPLLAFGQRTGQ